MYYFLKDLVSLGRGFCPFFKTLAAKNYHSKDLAGWRGRRHHKTRSGARIFKDRDVAGDLALV